MSKFIALIRRARKGDALFSALTSPFPGLKHLGPWEINPPEVWRVKSRPPPRATAPPPDVNIDYSASQLPEPVRRSFGGCNNYLYIDPEPTYI